MNGAQINPRSESILVEEWLTPGRFAVLLALFIAAMFPGIVLGNTSFVFRDFGMFSYPVAYFHRESFWRGELPLWNPLSSCGVPFLAQWNTLTLYPLSLIYLLLPLTWGLCLFCLGHVFLGGMGMYFLASRWTGNRLAAGLAGLIFSFNGLSLNFLMWPSHIATFGWLPWVVLLGQKGWLEGGKVLVWAILAGAMEMLAGGPETIMVTWLILFVLATGDWICRNGSRTKIVCRFAGMMFLVALVCGAQLLPFLELLSHSQRDSGYSASTHDWSIPFWGWANFLVPLFRTSPTAQGVFLQNGQYWTSSYYAGIGTILLVAVALRRARDWRTMTLAGLLLLGMVLALGDNSFLYRALHRCFPAIGFARYPVKFVILVLAIAPLLAAIGLTALSNGNKRIGRFEIITTAAMLLLIGLIVGMDWNSPPPADVWQATCRNALSRAAFLVIAFLALAALLKAEGRRRILLGGFLLTLFWLDFATHVPTQNPGAKPFIYTPDWVATQIKLDPKPKLGGSRVMLTPKALDFLKYNPLPGTSDTYLRNRLALRVNCNVLDGVPEIDGFFSLTPRESFRTTLLPYDHPDAEFPALLDFMGVSHVTVLDTNIDWVRRPTAMPMVTIGQEPTFTEDSVAFDAFSKTNTDFRQTVFLPAEARTAISATRQSTARVLDSEFGNQRVSIHAESPAPALLVISQTYYPAWKAFLDGAPVKLWRANYAFQALEIPTGSHQIELRYRDDWFRVGLVLSGVGLFAALALWWLNGRAKPAL